MPGLNLTEAEYNNYLATNQTAATQAMTQLFSDPDGVKAHQHWSTLTTAGSLSNLLLSPEMAPLLANEASSMARWPLDQLEELRQKLVTAVLEKRKVQFCSFLYNGRREAIAYEYSPTGDLVVRLISPQRNLRISNGRYSVVVNP
jgi:hypothetical protein